MASASAPNRRSGSISGSGSHEIDVEVEPPEYQALLLDTERERPPVQQREGKVESILTWLQNPFKSKSPRQQAELTSISVELPVPPNVTGARRREGRMASFTRSIRNCVGGTVTRSSRVLSLTDPLAAKVIAFMSNAFLVGILTLNIFSATYLLAWRKESNSCYFPFPAEVFENADTLTRLVVIALPFICFPLASVIGAFGNVAQKDLSYLGCAAGLALCEIIYILFLGSVMMSCVFNVSGNSCAAFISSYLILLCALTCMFNLFPIPATYTGIIAMAILCLIVFLWGCCCHQPKGLRYLVLSKCCCPDVDEDA